MKATYLIKGLVKSIPGIERFYQFHTSTGGTNNARYCYSAWLRHLCIAYEKGMTEVPETIAEFGPGDSLGIGLAALLSGSKKYYGLDIVRYSNTAKDLEVFEALVVLFRQKAPIPDGEAFPGIRPLLNSYDFPSHIFSDEQLSLLLNEERLAAIKHAIQHTYDDTQKDKMITFIVPWYDENIIANNSIDFIFSQAVLEHVDNLDQIFSHMYQWIKPGGMISHEIDFGSMGSASTWYGHWEYSDLEWKILKGRKLFYINREPCSTYLDLLKKYSFQLVAEQRTEAVPVSNQQQLALKFRTLSTEDLTTKNAFLQAIK
ncbi:MAG: methyltransferase domain-containing protein [Bacteroidota bacterium]|nr:methyltransferase domain-containing protein [Bacteroidota bacterium]